MDSAVFEVTDQQREACAVCVMRIVLLDYSNETGIPFKEMKVKLGIEKISNNDKKAC